MELFKVIYGRDLILPFDTPSLITKLSTVNDYYAQLIKSLHQAKSTVWYNIKPQQNIYKRTYATGGQDLPSLKLG